MNDSYSSREASDSCEFIELLPLPRDVRLDLIRRMTAPGRRYHSLAHLDLLWRRHRCFSAASGLRQQDHAPIAFAIAFHDAVYESGARDNEARSAALWLSVSADGSLCSDADRTWVAETIVATADHLGAPTGFDLDRPEHRARQWVLDLDLTPLGEAPGIFDANMADLAAEMPHLTPSQCRDSLMASLRRFASARPLYKSGPLREAFEATARANLARHLGKEAEASPPM